MPRMLRIRMPDRTTWGVPVDLIARKHAEAHAANFAGDVERCLAEHTLPLFAVSDFLIRDWAATSLAWDEVQAHAVLIKAAPPADLSAGWLARDTYVEDIELPAPQEVSE